jgi:hypothetical protein
LTKLSGSQKERGPVSAVKPFPDQLWESPVRISALLYQDILALAGEQEKTTNYAIPHKQKKDSGIPVRVCRG